MYSSSITVPIKGWKGLHLKCFNERAIFICLDHPSITQRSRKKHIDAAGSGQWLKTPVHADLIREGHVENEHVR